MISNIWTIIGASVIIGVVSLLIYCFVKTNPYVGQIKNRMWQTSSYLYRYNTYTRSGSYVPYGGRVISTYLTPVTKTRSIQTGKGKVKTSTYVVMELRYKYEIDEWDHMYTDKCSGVEDTQPVWPYDGITRTKPTSPKVGSEYIKDNTPNFCIDVAYKYKNSSYDHKFFIEKDLYKKLRTGETVSIGVNLFGMPLSFERLEGE